MFIFLKFEIKKLFFNNFFSTNKNFKKAFKKIFVLRIERMFILFCNR
jgi:hypothetical protein